MDTEFEQQPGGGRTVISDSAVAKVAAIAARAVPGVHSLGSGTPRALGAIREAVGSPDHVAGVRAEVGETQVAVDLTLVAEFGYRFQDIANAVRAAVYQAVEDLVGMAVIEVNIEINDVQLPGGKQDSRPARTGGSASSASQPGQSGAAAEGK
ncbi:MULTISPECIES: Asp23/Gls24 family envelope stress response protein [Arthrobacter]|uniref:Asp23/Gls24 family envelope stress response protein n=2 Tax=Arthrobacter TaxID=1663 RepID=A0ABU9KI34_9MICC|nr:Asp23/Gls24 family envelope stress response protein [Arthrobacter sp. YJM1]MDP5226424.1 Asp23/Gls24 family envelope stress response protein [Arthrobacter sp. YJM1]